MAASHKKIVARAAKALDKAKPGWAFDVRVLELFCDGAGDGYENCVLDQVFAAEAVAVGGYSGFSFAAHSSQRSSAVRENVDPQDAAYWPDRVGGYDKARKLWRNEVLIRRGKATGTRKPVATALA